MLKIISPRTLVEKRDECGSVGWRKSLAWAATQSTADAAPDGKNDSAPRERWAAECAPRFYKVSCCIQFMPKLDDSPLDRIIDAYRQSFSKKVFETESLEEDNLMLVFGLTQTAKTGNKQYWGRELGMCWQRLLASIFDQMCHAAFKGPIREGSDEICDFRIGTDGIDTKYRIGSGDSGTLKKFKQYGGRLKNLGYTPILLILRNDNLPAAIGACLSGGWTVLPGEQAYQYILAKSGIDLRTWLQSRAGKFKLP
jgi:hypothetical protein